MHVPERVGSGNHEGRAVVMLRLLGPWSDVDRVLRQIGKGTLSIVRGELA